MLIKRYEKMLRTCVTGRRYAARPTRVYENDDPPTPAEHVAKYTVRRPLHWTPHRAHQNIPALKRHRLDFAYQAEKNAQPVAAGSATACAVSSNEHGCPVG